MERLIRCQTNRIFPVATLSWNKYGDSFSIEFVVAAAAVSGVVARYNSSKTAVFRVALHCDEREREKKALFYRKFLAIIVSLGELCTVVGSP